jgi:hypothetical protein
MPLHVSENYDGQMTNQKGVHAFFETVLVEELDPKLKVWVLEKALKHFDKSEFKSMNSDAAVRALIADSFKAVLPLLQKDKTVSRDDIPAAAKKYKDMIVERLVQASILTAVVWEEILKPVNTWDTQKFYFFDGKPEYIEPGKETDESKVFAHR